MMWFPTLILAVLYLGGGFGPSAASSHHTPPAPNREGRFGIKGSILKKFIVKVKSSAKSCEQNLGMMKEYLAKVETELENILKMIDQTTSKMDKAAASSHNALQKSKPPINIKFINNPNITNQLSNANSFSNNDNQGTSVPVSGSVNNIFQGRYESPPLHRQGQSSTIFGQREALLPTLKSINRMEGVTNTKRKAIQITGNRLMANLDSALKMTQSSPKRSESETNDSKTNNVKTVTENMESNSHNESERLSEPETTKSINNLPTVVKITEVKPPKNNENIMLVQISEPTTDFYGGREQYEDSLFWPKSDLLQKIMQSSKKEN